MEFAAVLPVQWSADEQEERHCNGAAQYCQPAERRQAERFNHHAAYGAPGAETEDLHRHHGRGQTPAAFQGRAGAD